MRRWLLLCIPLLFVAGCSTSALFALPFDEVANALREPTAARTGRGTMPTWNEPTRFPWQTIGFDEDLSENVCKVEMETGPFRDASQSLHAYTVRIDASERASRVTAVKITATYCNPVFPLFSWRDRAFEQRMMKGLYKQVIENLKTGRSTSPYERPMR